MATREEGAIVKLDDDKHLVFGWAQVSVRKGESDPLVDHQGDRVTPDELEKAAYKFVLKSRTADEMHNGGDAGTLVESIVFTPEKVAKLGLPEGSVPLGWWVGFHVPNQDTWDKVKKGDYAMFSVGGKGTRTPVTKSESGFAKLRKSLWSLAKSGDGHWITYRGHHLFIDGHGDEDTTQRHFSDHSDGYPFQHGAAPAAPKSFKPERQLGDPAPYRFDSDSESPGAYAEASRQAASYERAQRYR